MRVFLLTALLCSACLPHDEANISQSSNVTGNDLTNTNSPNYIEAGECLVNINGVLDLNTRTSLSPLDNQQCLPSSKLSWLFRAEEQTQTTTQTTKKNLQLAILFDTSYSLQTTDPSNKRYTALEADYLLPLFEEVSAAGVEATIKFFPFKYCNKAEHRLDILYSTTEEQFKKDIKGLIASLKSHGVKGSTNYLQSFALAADFLGRAPQR